METTLEGEDRGNSVKRGPGRPPKVAAVLHKLEDGERTFSGAVTPLVSPAQSLALRVWSGQSPDVSTIERVARVAKALKDQGMSLDITLPHHDAERFLEAHR